MKNPKTKLMLPEKFSPFLRDKMRSIGVEKGEHSEEYKAIYLQYTKLDREDMETKEKNVRHWEADLDVQMGGYRIRGLERLYRRSLVIEPTMICAAHCRYCLRANYEIFTLKESEIISIARYCGSEAVREELREVLITGGDPLIVPQKLRYLIEALMEHAPNIKIMRIATRLLTQDPARIDNNVFEIFRNKPSLCFELATQINHPVEFFPETVEKIGIFGDIGVRIYSQNVLLKGVNDNIRTLIELYDAMRGLNIEPHYLFHCIPMKGIHHLRTTVDKGLRLTKELENSGAISGRAKPMYALMTDIGKIILYEGTILKKDESTGRILFQSAYRYKDRMRWNANWILPKTAEVDENGYLRVWYLDGHD